MPPCRNRKSPNGLGALPGVWGARPNCFSRASLGLRPRTHKPLLWVHSRTRLDVPDVVHELVGDVLAALAKGLRGHLVVRVPVPVSRVGVGGAGGGVVHSRSGHDAHGFPWGVGEEGLVSPGNGRVQAVFPLPLLAKDRLVLLPDWAPVSASVLKVGLVASKYPGSSDTLPL